MSDRVKALLPLIEQLSDQEFAELRHSLEEPELTNDEWETAWAAECERRILAQDQDPSRLIPLDEVFEPRLRVQS